MNFINLFQSSLKKAIFIVLLFLFYSQVYATVSPLQLTKEEQSWLKNHPEITVGADQNWPPFDFVNAQKKHQGISSDYLNLISAKLNIQFKITAGVWKDMINGVKSKQLDMLACASNTEERRKYLNFTHPYIEIDTVFVTRVKKTPINSLTELANKTVALPKGTYIHELLIKQAQKFSFLFVKSNQEALQAVSLGTADAYVGNLAVVSHFIEQDLLTNLRIDNRLPAEKSKIAFAINKDLPILHRILQKALDSISNDQHREISRKWIHFNSNRETKKTPSLSLSTEDHSWLQAHKNIRIGIDPAWAPIEYIDPHTRKYLGIASEYINYFEKALSIKASYNPELSWEQVIEKVKTGEIDMLPAVSKTAEREKYLSFSRPYLKFPYVIFTRNDADLITSIEELIDKTIVVEKNYANHDILKSSYPEINLILVDNTQQALSVLSLGQADAYMGNLAATSHIMLQTGITNIKVAAPTPYSNDLSIAIRKDWPELLDIIQHALDSISAKQSNAFKKKWFSIRYDHRVDRTLIWKIIAIGLCLFLMYSLWIWQIRKQKDALRLSEERFQLAMQASKEGLWDWNIKTNEVYFSPGYAEMLGYQQQELEKIHASWKNLLHPDDKKATLHFLAREIKQCSKQYSHEFRLRHKSGQYLHIRSIGSVVSTENGKAIRSLGTQQNITEQKNTQTLLEQQKFALDASSIVVITDVKGTISYVNEQFCLISGYSQEELIGQNHRILNSNTHPRSFWTAMFRQASKGIPWRQEICNKAKNGSLYWVDSTIIGIFSTQGILEQYIAIRTDITKRKLTEQKLKKSEQQFSSLIHTIPSTFYQFVYNHGWSISFISNAIQTVSGYPASLFVSKQQSLTAITHPDDIHIIAETVHRAIKTLLPYTMEYRIIHKDKSIRWIHEKGIAVYDNNHQAHYLQGAIFDITKNKQAEIELAKAKQIAEKANQFKSNFLSNMSHEIRTPMNAIVGLGYLALQTELSSQQQDYIKKIQTASQSLLTIINDILDFSKIEAGKLHLESIGFQLDSVFETLADLFRFSCEEKNIELIFDIDPKIPATLIGDPTRLSQILINLCSNALKFTEQGEIKVTVESIETSTHKATLKFSVTDTGCGIAPEQQQYLFNSFFQTDASTTRTHGGTGLGLAISKQLIGLMNGSLGVNSEPEKGSHFFFVIDCGIDSQQKISPALMQPELKNLKVLVVDDNMTARQVLRNQLASLSFKVTTVASANEAYAVIKSAEKAFDLILMDWSMPEINGLDAVKHIKNKLHLNHIPAIIMLTAYAQEEVINEAKQHNLDSFILKPATPSTLFDQIIKVLHPSLSPALTSSQNTQSQKLLSGSILLVEDNKINQQVAEELLKSFGLKVTIAVNGLDAIEQLTLKSAHHHTFDLVLMDIQMPEMDGIQATQKIRANPSFKSLPIIAMTAHAMTGDKAKSLAAGMNEHITKPIDPSELYKQLQQWLQRSDSPSLPVKSITKPEDITLLPDYSEHLDVAWGLKIIGGNRKLFSKLLKDFYDDHFNDIQKLEMAFEQKQTEDMKRIIHTIKGVTGNIGAQKLHKQAMLLEQSINLKQDYELDFNLFKTHFNALMSELKHFKNLQLNTSKVAPALSDGQLGIQIKKLYQLLNDGDTDAIDTLSGIESYFPASSAQKVLQLQQTIENYDFEQAIIILIEISDNLQISVA